MKISIITVCYNAEKFIENCINSVLSQTYKNIEFILIDGASRDNTLSIIKKYNKYITKLISEPDAGIYDAMNKGIQISTGEIIGFLNSDDFYSNHEVLLKVALEFKKNEKLKACYADLVYVKQKKEEQVIRFWKSGNFHYGSFSNGWSPPHPTFFVHRSVYEKYGNFDLNYRISSDVELMMRFLDVNKINVKYIPEIWVKMRMGGLSNNKFKNIFKQNFEVLTALRRHGLKSNLVVFFYKKFLSRFKQFIFKSKNYL